MKKKPLKKAKPKASKKTKARKPAKTKTKAKAKAAAGSPKSGIIAPVNSVFLGFVEDYFAKVGVIAFTLKAPLSVGQRIQVLGHTTHFEQVVDSMQMDHMPVTQAKAKDGIGIKVSDRARGKDHVYLLK